MSSDSVVAENPICDTKVSKDSKYYMSQITELFEKAAPDMTVEEKQKLVRLQKAIVDSCKDQIYKMEGKFRHLYFKAICQADVEVGKKYDEMIDTIASMENMAALYSAIDAYEGKCKLKESKMKLEKLRLRIRKQIWHNYYLSETQNVRDQVEILDLEMRKAMALMSLKKAEQNVFF